jgi:UDP-N-acetylmuramoyl-L-alanyl-D-glutamate--2,6-diaminopimelate ligase
MKISQLIGPEVVLSAGTGDAVVTSLTADSRAVTAGVIFAALPGTATAGRRFIPDAIAKGAAAILVLKGTEVTAPAHVAVLHAAEPRLALAKIAARLYSRQPAHIVAITGTNGKTSVADFTRQILTTLGHNAASLGTIGIVKASGAVYGSLTTPDPVTLHKTLGALATDGVTHLAMEASSHGLDQFRLDGVKLTAGAFLNLGRDHLDYHPTVDDYLTAKLRLFRELLTPGQPAVVVAEAPYAGAAIAAAHARGLTLMTVGTAGETLRLKHVAADGFRQRLIITHNDHDYSVPLNLIGTYQASNALAAAALAICCGEDPARAIAAIEHLRGVSGRLEIIGEAHGAIAIVDYAHKPEALAAALDAVRPFASGRLVCVMGCGGDRDKGKRPLMGAIAAEKADIVIVTDDNPRNETPASIRAEILAGIPASKSGTLEIGDRAEAIHSAVRLLRKGDVLLVAGKGHETGQIVGNTTIPFSDQDTVSAALARISGYSGHSTMGGE